MNQAVLNIFSQHCEHENDGQPTPGAFAKLEAWAAHAAKLGCTAIYIGPLFESGSHGYDTIDYRRVDRRLGTNEEFREFVANCHARGQKVIVDGVFNHCGSFNKWLDAELLYQHAGVYPQGAYVSEDSPYRYFFQFHNENAWPFNDSYDGWWGHATLPKLNYEESPELYQYILGIAKKWVSAPFGADGWRLDVAADLGRSAWMNHQFWRDFRAAALE